MLSNQNNLLNFDILISVILFFVNCHQLDSDAIKDIAVGNSSKQVDSLLKKDSKCYDDN